MWMMEMAIERITAWDTRVMRRTMSRTVKRQALSPFPEMAWELVPWRCRSLPETIHRRMGGFKRQKPETKKRRAILAIPPADSTVRVNGSLDRTPKATVTAATRFRSSEGVCSHRTGG
jgi:hypothetical protein